MIHNTNLPQDTQEPECYATIEIKKQFEMAIEVACCSECGNRGSIAYIGWEKDLCRACDAPTKLDVIVKRLLEVVKVYNQQMQKAERRRIFKAMHITREQMLELPLDIRQDILEQQVNNYLENISDEEKLKELHKLD